MNFKQVIKNILADSNQDTYLEYEVNVWLSNHDRDHMDISKLPAINMGGVMVTGIDGLSIPEFGRENLPSYYSAYLDECRVAIHQWCKTKTLLSWARLLYWVYWMVCNKINPIKTISNHIKSM